MIDFGAAIVLALITVLSLEVVFLAELPAMVAGDAGNTDFLLLPLVGVDTGVVLGVGAGVGAGLLVFLGGTGRGF